MIKVTAARAGEYFQKKSAEALEVVVGSVEDSKATNSAAEDGKSNGGAGGGSGASCSTDSLGWMSMSRTLDECAVETGGSSTSESAAVALTSGGAMGDGTSPKREGAVLALTPGGAVGNGTGAVDGRTGAATGGSPGLALPCIGATRELKLLRDTMTTLSLEKVG